MKEAVSYKNSTSVTSVAEVLFRMGVVIIISEGKENYCTPNIFETRLIPATSASISSMVL